MPVGRAVPGLYEVLDEVVSTAGDPKAAVSSTWMRYDVAPLTLPQLKVGVSSLTVLPSAGEERLGAGDVATMAKLQTDNQGLSPELEACTRH